MCVSKLTIIGSDNGLSPDRHQAIIWTNAGILLIGPLGTNLSEISIEILTFSFKKMHLKVSSAKQRPFCLGLNVLKINCLKFGLKFPGANELTMHMLLPYIGVSVWELVYSGVQKGQINEQAALVETLFWRQTTGKPLSEPIMSWFLDAYMCHLPLMNSM